MKKIILLLLLILTPVAASAQENLICAVYFTGIGCPHCAKSDPVVLNELLRKTDNLVVIEYEIYQDQVNAPLLDEYDFVFGTGYGIPKLIFTENNVLTGDYPIIDNINTNLASMKNNPCLLLTGAKNFNEINLNDLPGKPKIWYKNKIIKSLPSSNFESELVKKLLLSENMSFILKEYSWVSYSLVEPKKIPLSGGSIPFQNALGIGNSVIQWDGESIEGVISAETVEEDGKTTKVTTDLTIPKIISLAAVDAVNPCEIAVLTLMLIAILTYNPKNKRNVLLAGFSFSLAVYLLYIFYGLVIIRFFQIVQALTSIRLLLYKLLGVIAIILGILNIKDFIKYKPGGFATEMPMFLRPKVKKLIRGVTSPKGAFVVGAFVTIFLMPCTIGPYIIAGGILSALDLIKTIPWLIFYNLIFISPMIIITLLVYLGFTTVENVSGWKEKNIRYLHLIAGTIIILLGIGMLMGWV